MKINPHDPAYPNTVGINRAAQSGLPIRLELAARFMAVIIVDARNNSCDYDLDAESALAAADALISAYNEGQE